MMIIPMYAAAAGILALTRFDECWVRRWHAALWGIAFVGASPLPWMDILSTAGAVQGTLGGEAAHWTADQWLYQLQHAYGTLVYYADAGGWRAFTRRPMLLPPDVALIALSLIAFRARRGRVFLVLCWVWVLLVILLGGALLPNPANFYHLLEALPFLVLLVAVGVEQLRWWPVMVPVVLGLMWLHFTVLFDAVAPTSALATVAAMRWISNHRDLSCITLLRGPDDPDFANCPLYAFVRDVKVIDNDPTALHCPAVIIFPHAQAPLLPPGDVETVPSAEGPVQIWRPPQTGAVAVGSRSQPGAPG